MAKRTWNTQEAFDAASELFEREADLATVPADGCVENDQPIPYKLSPLALAALANGVAFEDVEAFVQAGASYNKACNLEAEEAFQHELDVALHKSATAREPERSVLFWKAASL